MAKIPVPTNKQVYQMVKADHARISMMMMLEKIMVRCFPRLVRQIKQRFNVSIQQAQDIVSLTFLNVLIKVQNGQINMDGIVNYIAMAAHNKAIDKLTNKNKAWRSEQSLEMLLPGEPDEYDVAGVKSHSREKDKNFNLLYNHDFTQATKFGKKKIQRSKRSKIQ